MNYCNKKRRSFYIKQEIWKEKIDFFVFFWGGEGILMAFFYPK